MATNSVAHLIDRINAVASNASAAEILQDQAARAALLQASRELTTALQQPDEVVSVVAYISGGGNMCVRLAIDLNLFDQLAQVENPMTAEQLAKESNAEPGLVQRILRVLVGMGFAANTSTVEGKVAFLPTAVTRHMIKPSVKAGIRFFYDQGSPILAKAPDYFRSNGYRLPQNESDGPFNFAHNTLEDCFTYWSKQEGVMENFNVFMNGVFGSPGRLHWTDWFPFEEICFDGFDPAIGGSDYTWVDVGGGKGHHVQQLINKYPSVRGHFAIQDLPFVIDDIEASGFVLSPRIKPMKHDFLTPQPIKGARTYWMANILDVPLRQSGLDIAMLSLHSGFQKTESENREFLEKAGFKVNRVWLPPGDGDGIVEAEVPVQ